MTRIEKLRHAVEELYKKPEGQLLFHGWHHVAFVTDKAAELAAEMGANVEIVEAAALTHDFNYIVEKNSKVGIGSTFRREVLMDHGFETLEIERIEVIVTSASTSKRDESINVEAQILSDADTLFKALPITPIIFAGRYIQANDVNLKELARKVVEQQSPLFEKGIYFYTPIYKERYMDWAKQNLFLWQSVLKSLDDPDIRALLQRISIQVD